MIVDKLIDADKRLWNMDMIKEMMNENDVSYVAQIQLCKKGKSDRLIWRDSNIGVFSVRLAYYVARGILEREELIKEHRESFWRRVWIAKVAFKVKLFM